MKLSFSTLGCPTWSTEKIADTLAANGYHGVELRIMENEVIDPAKLDRGARQALRRVYHSRGLDVVCVGASSRFSAMAFADRLAQEKGLLAYIELAADLDAPLVRTFGGETPEGATLEQSMARVAEHMNRVARRAEELGVTVALETHDGFSRSTTVMGAMAQVNSPAIGVLWDTHHPYRMGETAAETYERVKDRLVHVHIKDAVKKADGGWQLVLLGKGEVTCKESMQVLKAAGYKGYFSAEWEKKWHAEIEEPEIAIPQFAQVMREYLA